MPAEVATARDLSEQKTEEITALQEDFRDCSTGPGGLATGQPDDLDND
jgi:hypothetical protein